MAAAMSEIASAGSVVAVMELRRDFFRYECAPPGEPIRVYTERSNSVGRVRSARSYRGHHAVRIVGWGHRQASSPQTLSPSSSEEATAGGPQNATDDDGTAYWIVGNSWNAHWGCEGFAYVARGVNAFGIERRMYALDVTESS